MPNYLHVVFTTVGLIAVIAVAVLLLALAYCSVMREITERRARIRARIRTELLRGEGVRMQRLYHWFGADVHLAALWLAIADTMAEGNAPSGLVDIIRDQAYPEALARLRKEWGPALPPEEEKEPK